MAETSAKGDRAQAGKPGDAPTSGSLRCDFCGEQVPTVRRVALDGDYERLRTPHRELYACGPCSERKEQERRGLPAPGGRGARGLG